MYEISTRRVPKENRGRNERAQRPDKEPTDYHYVACLRLLRRVPIDVAVFDSNRHHLIDYSRVHPASWWCFEPHDEH